MAKKGQVRRLLGFLSVTGLRRFYQDGSVSLQNGIPSIVFSSAKQTQTLILTIAASRDAIGQRRLLVRVLVAFISWKTVR